MAIVRTLIGNVKGPQGDTGATGATGPSGADGAAATIQVGTVSTTAYGNPARVTNSGTESAAVFDFVLPQGPAGATVTDASDLVENTITASSESYPVPTVGETLKVIFGKIIKNLSDLLNAVNSKLDTANVVNNFTTTASGYALDARAGKTLNDSLAPCKSVEITGSGGSKTFTFNSMFRGVLYLVGGNGQGCAQASIYAISSSSSLFIAWYSPDNLTKTFTTSASGFALTVTTGSTGGAIYASILAFRGSVTVS